PIQVAPLRDRREDIPLLVEHFLRLHAASAGREIRGVDEKTMEMLKGYAWPGNIRELQNVIERWAIICDTEEISMDESWLPRDSAPALEPAALEPAPGPMSDEPVNLRKHIEETERGLIGRTMTAVAG